MMGRKAVSTALLLVVVLALWPAPWRTDRTSLAHAGEGDDIAVARSLLDDGDDHLARGERLERRGQQARAFALYEQALGRYRKAYQLVPKPTIFFAIAGAEAKLERYLDAIGHYQRVIAEVADEGLREQARARIGALSAHVAIVELDVRPAGAAISIDREPRGKAPIEGSIYLAAGEHTITVTAEGYTPFEESLMLRPGKPVRREIELSDVTMLVKAPKSVQMGAAPMTPADARPAPSKAVVIVGTALTVAMAAGATATGLLALSKHSEFEAGDPVLDRDERRELARTGRTLAGVTDGLAIGAALIGTYTLYRYLGVYRPERAVYEDQRAISRRPPDTIWLAPYAGAQGGGLAVSGRF
jgi:tetratricopeptide (TPR) repeat protein